MRIGFLALFLAVSANTLANDLFDLTLEELMRVVVVSGQEETILYSPGTVSTYYPIQLQRMGLHTLPEMLRFAAGVQISDGLISEEVIQIRGLSDADNQKILFLVDGIPYWMPSHGNVPLYGIPLNIIEKIEVIRGPASVIYGTNSSAGVVNIVTRATAENSASIVAGANNLRTLNVSAGTEFTNGMFNIGYEKTTDDGFDAQAKNTFLPFDGSCFCFPTAPDTDYQKNRESESLLARARYAGLSVTLQTFTNERNQLANNSAETPGVRKQYGQLASLRYEHSFGTAQFTAYSDWNRFYREDDIENFLGLFGIAGGGGVGMDNHGQNNTRWLNGVKLNQKLNEHWSLLTGLEFEERTTENSRFMDDSNGAQIIQLTQPPLSQPYEIQPDGSILLFEEDSLSEASAFIQTDYTSGAWRYVVGARYVDNEYAGSYTAPRLSAVWRYSDQQAIKFLYAEGFNSPTFRQLSARNQLGIMQPIDIEAEVIRSYELAWVKTQTDLHQGVTAFHIEADGLIQVNSTGVFNSDKVLERQGLEYELTLQAEQWSYWFATTYLHQGNERKTDDRSALYQSRWLAKAGVQKQWQQHTFGGSIRFSSARYQVAENSLLNLSYRYQYVNYSAFITLVNALDREVYDPDVRSLQESQVQAEDRAHILMGAEVQF